MSTKQIWNDGWRFSKYDGVAPANMEKLPDVEWEKLDLPHTWNGMDGQDGGNDYYRGTCTYIKSLKKSDLPTFTNCYLEFEGVNSSADVYVNGKTVGHHDGGYSTWRVNVTDFLQEENVITIMVDNSMNDRVYPQMADFTFYGGIYRNVSLICTDSVHFDLDNYGGPAIKITPEVKGEKAVVEVEVFVSNPTGSEELIYIIKDAEQEIEVRTLPVTESKTVFEIENIHLWHGKKDPYLYTAHVILKQDEKVLDERVARFGCRTFAIDSEKGFLLNGESYPLRGVSRHQDFKGIGNALTKEHHERDMDLICEVGATTIRLAHYQHDQYFYDLCDERGMVVWAEIPYISKHLENGTENTISQMKELVTQNYNHPSIVVWGLSNEVSMGGASNQKLIDNHNLLNDLVHQMDKTRLTTIAAVSMVGIDEEYVHISDVVSYNHYFGWYGGDTSQNGPWLDNFHAKYPKKPIGLSEYGCEALDWHSSEPEQGDYTEEYQAYYHEELIKQLFTRPYIWATHVWNMFDFAADGRAEGGENGMNHKGLVNFDRTYKKDSFYAYKAWLNEDPFVHICSKKYIDRVEDMTKVTVYSNLPEVELFVNGKSVGTQKSDVHFFYFNISNEGDTTIIAKAGECVDESHIRKVDVFNEDYRMKEIGDILNWFEITAPEGYFSINDKIGTLMEHEEGRIFFGSLMKKMMPESIAQASNQSNEGMNSMMSSFTVKRMMSMLGGFVEKKITKEDMLQLNQQLNKIKK